MLNIFGFWVLNKTKTMNPDRWEPHLEQFEGQIGAFKSGLRALVSIPPHSRLSSYDCMLDAGKSQHATPHFFTTWPFQPPSLDGTQ